jgi:hypothetical protein
MVNRRTVVSGFLQQYFLLSEQPFGNDALLLARLNQTVGFNDGTGLSSVFDAHDVLSHGSCPMAYLAYM